MDFLNKSFDIKGLSKAREWINEFGKLGITAREFKENKFRQLVKTLDTLGKIDKDVMTENQRIAQGTALKNIAAEYPNVAKAVEKFRKEVEKLNRSYQKQLDLLSIRQARQDAQNNLKIIQLERKESEAIAKTQEVENKRNEIANKRTVINLQKTLDTETQKLDVLKREFDLRNQMLDIEHERGKLAILALTRQERANLDLEKGRAGAFPGLYTEKNLQALETRELELNVVDAERLLEQQRTFEREKMKNATMVFNNELVVLELERGLQRQQFTNDKKIAEDRQQLLADQLATARLEVGEQEGLREYAMGGLIERDLNERKTLAKEEMAAAKINAKAAHDEREIALDKMAADADFLTVMTGALFNHADALKKTLEAHVTNLGYKTVDEKGGDKTLKKLRVLSAYARTRGDRVGEGDSLAEGGRTGLYAKSDEMRKAQEGLATSQYDAAAGEGGTLEREANLQHQIAVDRIRMLESEVFNAKLAVDDFEERKTLEKQHHNALVHGLEIQMGLEDEAAGNRLEEAQLNLKNAQDALTAQENLNEVINNQFTRIVDSVSESIQGRVSTAVRDLTTAMNEGTLTMDNFKEGFKSFIVGVMQDIQQAILDELVTKLINNMISDMANSLTSSGGGIKNLFSDVIGGEGPDAAAALTSGAGTATATGITTSATGITTAMTTAATTVTTGMTTAATTVTTGMTTAATTITTAMTTAATTIATTVTTVATTVTTVMTTAATTVTTGITTMSTTLSTSIITLGSTLMAAESPQLHKFKQPLQQLRLVVQLVVFLVVMSVKVGEHITNLLQEVELCIEIEFLLS